MSNRARERSRATAVIAAAVALIAVSAAVISQAASRSRGETLRAAGGAKTVAVELGDLYVKPSSITVPAGTDLTLEVSNKGAVPHDLAREGAEPKTPLLDPGGKATLRAGKVTARPGSGAPSPATRRRAWC